MEAAMNTPDGPEQREADNEERSERESDRIDAIEDRADSDLMDLVATNTVQAQITKLTDTALTIKDQRDEAHAALRDIIQGADMMLQPALQVKGAMRHYIQEVKRVATQGLTA
jgi:hypothetical protein